MEVQVGTVVDDLAARRATHARLALRSELHGPHRDDPAEADPRAAGRAGRLRLETLAGALAAADGATWDHSLEVAKLATVIGRRLGLGDAELADLHLAALLHDVGKIRLPAQILRKPGPLDAGEWRLVRRHPEWGAELVASIPGFGRVAEIVLLHHERPDGRGYPFGLKGEQIPLASSIVAACDAFEAITTGRPYRAPVGRRAALAAMGLEAGTQLDADVVDALTAVCDSRQPVSA